MQETRISNYSLFSLPQQCCRDESLRRMFWCCLIKEHAVYEVILKGKKSCGWGFPLSWNTYWYLFYYQIGKHLKNSLSVILKLSLVHEQFFLYLLYFGYLNKWYLNIFFKTLGLQIRWPVWPKKKNKSLSSLWFSLVLLVFRNFDPLWVLTA